GAYDDWIDEQAGIDAGEGLSADIADEERRSHERDLEAYRRESGYIRTGIELMQESREAAQILSTNPPAARDALEALAKQAVPWESWLRTNEAFELYGAGQYTNWRLFQLAFILAHLPTFASRTDAFADRFDAFRDELSASLLYF